MKTSRFLPLGLISVTLLVLGAACSLGPDGDGGGTSSDRKVVPAPIDNLSILVRESFPPQYAVQITSGLPSGCAQFHEAKLLGRTGNTITITVTNTLPADPEIVCTAIYGTHESTVELGSDFISGQQYTVDVNGTTTTFTAQ